MGKPKQGARCCSVLVSGEKLGAHSILTAELLTQHGSAGISNFSLISAHRGRKAKSFNKQFLSVYSFTNSNGQVKSQDVDSSLLLLFIFFKKISEIIKVMTF